MKTTSKILIPAIAQTTRDELRPIIVAAIERWEGARARAKEAKKPRAKKEEKFELPAEIEELEPRPFRKMK